MTALVFHRVIAGFMIQGAIRSALGPAVPAITFEDEFTPDQKHDKAGILAMANPAPTPTAASSSSRWRPPRGSTASTPSSARSPRE